MESQGFPRIHSIFFVVFDNEKGPVVLHQVPEGTIVPHSPEANPSSSHPENDALFCTKPIIDFDAISEYIITKEQLNGRLVTICNNNYKVMGVPVRIKDHIRYIRNEYRFNLCFVFERDAETSSYEPIVQKIATVLEVLERECDFLTSEKTLPGAVTIQNVIEQMLEDLNSYCECQIPINASNTINLKLFPTYPNPTTVQNYHVPVCTVDLASMMSINWDITICKVIKHINGISSVRRIADKADVKIEWARQSIEHLLYYGCIILIDIYQFSNVYSIKPEVMQLLDEKSGLQEECIDYVTLPNHPAPSVQQLFKLYCGLQHGVTLRKLIDGNKDRVANIDLRRMVTFGVIKGLIYRVYKYPILFNLSTATAISPGNAPIKIIIQNTGNAIHPQLIPFLDGHHHYDEICTELRCSPKELDEQLGYNPDTLIKSNDETNPDATADVKPAGPAVDDNVNSTSLDSRELKRDSSNPDSWVVEFIFR
ncbi:hypothetical protein INT43_005498 [Umbelopsis isabellina]|uniref:Nitrogen permease regulator 2 n=1 Tax=Mortierella isabellina TaxID=91625 RepID=A0A8H7PLC2_MORIS|nr:hypothetical protein INT43_005498 [Umbelopsis isabellina]